MALPLAKAAAQLTREAPRSAAEAVEVRPLRESIPPKYAVSQVVGFIKGKSAIHLARVYAER